MGGLCSGKGITMRWPQRQEGKALDWACGFGRRAVEGNENHWDGEKTGIWAYVWKTSSTTLGRTHTHTHTAKLTHKADTHPTLNSKYSRSLALELYTLSHLAFSEEGWFPPPKYSSAGLDLEFPWPQKKPHATHLRRACTHSVTTRPSIHPSHIVTHTSTQAQTHTLGGCLADL